MASIHELNDGFADGWNATYCLIILLIKLHIKAADKVSMSGIDYNIDSYVTRMEYTYGHLRPKFRS